MPDDDEKVSLPDNIRRVAPLCYSVLYARMASIASTLGYALTLHGSMIRDCDMVAVPWINEAVSQSDLAKAMEKAAFGIISEPPKRLPWGRVAYVIHLGAGPYIDLSVMPTTLTEAVEVAGLEAPEPFI